MSTTLAAGIASAKTAFDIIKGIKSIDDQTKLNTVMIEAQQHVLAVQQSMGSALIEINDLTKKKDDLESKLVEQSEWKEKESDYHLVEVRKGLFVQEFSPCGDDSSIPPHQACPSCFSKKRIEVLQQPSPTKAEVKCFQCGFSVDKRSRIPKRSTTSITSASLRRGKRI